MQTPGLSEGRWLGPAVSQWNARSKRRLLKSTHIWVGILGGGLLSIIALTGSLIVFRAEWERAAFPKPLHSSTSSHVANLDQAWREVARVRPASQLRRVRLPEKPGDVYIFQIESNTGTDSIVADSNSGRVLGTLQSGWVDWVIDLHRNLLAGRAGRKVVGVGGILLFTLSLTGLLMWITGRRNWRSWVVVRGSGPPRRFYFELHRAAGLWGCGFLAVISFTGIGLAYPDSFRAAVKVLGGRRASVSASRQGKKKNQHGAGVEPASNASLDRYLQAGRRAMPDGVPVELRLPAGKALVDLRLHRAGDIAPSGNHVYLDPSTAMVARVERIADEPLGARFLAAISAIHYGEFGGTPTKAVWAVFALTLPLLFVSGLIAWWRPRKQTDSPKSGAAHHFFIF
jgi:uncharacterized iron-regulated membrane protein